MKEPKKDEKKTHRHTSHNEYEYVRAVNALNQTTTWLPAAFAWNCMFTHTRSNLYIIIIHAYMRWSHRSTSIVWSEIKFLAVNHNDAIHRCRKKTKTMDRDVCFIRLNRRSVNLASLPRAFTQHTFWEGEKEAERELKKRTQNYFIRTRFFSSS